MIIYVRYALVALLPALPFHFSPCTVTAATPTTSSMESEASQEVSKAIEHASQGGIVEIPVPALPGLPRLAYEKQPSGPQFVFTDDPEYIRLPEAATVREVLEPGRARLYLYHVNATTDTATKKITAVIENLSSSPMSLRFLKSALPAPGREYYRIGKEGMLQFLSQSAQDSTAPVQTIEPGAAVVFDPHLDALRPAYDELVHGWYEFETDQPARLTVLQTFPETPSVEAARRITSILPPRNEGGGAGRGRFPVSTYEVTTTAPLDTAAGPVQLVVADGKEDPWITGWDASRNAQAINKGNYGVVYDIRVKRRSSDGRALALVMYNFRTGDKWCDHMAAAVQVSSGKFPAGVVPVPGEQLHVTGLDRGVVVQVFEPLPAGQEDEIRIVYTPPGASCLPTPLVFLPVDKEVPGSGK